MHTWTQEKEQKLSYLRLMSRNAGLTEKMREDKDKLELEFERIVGERFPGSVKARRETGLPPCY